MPTIQVNNINMYYEFHGEGEPLVLVSGFSADHHLWDLMLNNLAKKYRVLMFDNRGVGQTDSSASPCSIELMADDLAGLLQALNIPQAHVVGHSMGGYIAQQFAIRHPDKIHKLVLACTREKGALISFISWSINQRLREAGTPRELVIENTMPFLFSEKYLSAPRHIENFVKNMAQKPPHDPQGYLNQIEALRGHDTTLLLTNITAPTLVIGCDEDILVPIKGPMHLANTIPSALLAIVKESGHMLPIEKPQEFTHLVLNFLG